MTAITASQDSHVDDALARRNVFVLAAASALGGGNSTVMLATAAIVGVTLAPSKILATLPVTAFVIGQWAGTIPLGLLAHRFGRRVAYQCAAGVGMFAGLTAYSAIMQGSFALFILSFVLAGVYGSANQSYRFAAADTASDAFRPKAISWVMAGGVVAAVFGPQLVIWTKDLLPPYLFAASYLSQSVVAVIAFLVLSQVRIPRLADHKAVYTGRPLGEFLRMPRFLIAVGAGVASFALMSLVMTSAPLAMIECSHTVTDATLGLQWHVLGMFGPSFFTGSLCARFGADRVSATGLLLIALSAVVAISGVTLAHFWISLLLLGLGWNFGLIGATTMVASLARPEERIRVQALNDFLVFGSLAFSSLLSGGLLATGGWAVVNAVVFPVVLVAGGLLLWQIVRQRAAVPA